MSKIINDNRQTIVHKTQHIKNKQHNPTRNLE